MSVSGQLRKIEQRIRAKAHIVAETVCNQIMEETKEKLRFLTMKNWYNNYDPKVYRRSYDFVKSIVGKVTHLGLTYTIEVKFDSQLIKPEYRHNEGWNAHMSFDQSPFTEELIDVIEFGATGIQSNPRRGYGAHMLKDTQSWLNQYAKKEFQQRFQQSFK